jgi:hypothetical protein
MCPGDIEIEASYSGPRTENGQITQKFVEELMAWQKAEKRLHKKFALEILCKVLLACLVLASAEVLTTSFTGFTSFSLLKILCKVREIFRAEATVVDVEVTDDGEEVRSTCIAGTNIFNFRY